MFIISIYPNLDFVIILFFIILPFLLFVLLFVMGKDIGRIYKYSQSQLSTSSLKSPVSSSSYPQSSSDIELTRNSVPSVREKNKINSILYYQNITQNDASITNNDDIQSYETARFFLNHSNHFNT